MTVYRKAGAKDIELLLHDEALKYVAAPDVPDELLEFVGQAASDLLLEEIGNEAAAFEANLVPYLSSFLTEPQATVAIANVLKALSVAPAKVSPPPPPVAPPVPVEVSSGAHTVALQSNPTPYQPKWVTPSVGALPSLPPQAPVAATPPLPSARAATPAAPSVPANSLIDTVFSMAFGGRTLLSRTRLRLERGRRYGLVGANGAGKSTLLRNLALKRIEGLPEDLRIALVQHAADSSVNKQPLSAAAGVEAAAVETVLEHLARHAPPGRVMMPALMCFGKLNAARLDVIKPQQPLLVPWQVPLRAWR